MTLKKIVKQVGALGVACGMALGAMSAQAEETIKVGVLHSLSGTMAISETTLKDTMLMLIEEQNKKGGLLGKQLEPRVLPAHRCARRLGECQWHVHLSP